MQAKNIGIKEKMEIAHKLISENGGLLRRTIFQQTRDHHLADDIFQDFFISIVKKPLSDNIENVDAYLKSLVRHDVIDAVRRQKTKIKHRNKYYDYRKNLRNPRNDPADVLMNKEQKQEIYSVARKRLPPSQFLAIALRYE